MLVFENKEQAREYLEHVLRLFGTTAMDHWTDADAFDIRNAIAVITDKDFGWSTEIPDSSCIAWKCIISRLNEHVMRAETFLMDATRSHPYGVIARETKGPIFRELHHIPKEEEEFWPKEPLTLYKVIDTDPPYSNMLALIKKTKVKEYLCQSME